MTTRTTSTARPARERTRRAGVETEVVHGEPVARAWAEMSVTINLGDYESTKVTLGTSRTVEDSRTAVKRMHRQMHQDHETLLAEKVEEVRLMWQAAKSG
jgi:hypothetical protein